MQPTTLTAIFPPSATIPLFTLTSSSFLIRDTSFLFLPPPLEPSSTNSSYYLSFCPTLRFESIMPSSETVLLVVFYYRNLDAQKRLLVYRRKYIRTVPKRRADFSGMWI